MIQAGQFYDLRVVKTVDFGVYLDGDGQEILLPTRFVPEGLKEDDTVRVFVYHDSENRLIATTQEPAGQVGDIVLLEVVSLTPQGAFMNWGLMKDVFVPLSQQVARMHTGKKYLVRIYRDEQTGRVAATERFERYLSNEPLTVTEGEAVDLRVWQKTDLGYKVIINNRHTGVLYFNEVFEELEYGQQLRGYIKKIRPDGKVDAGLGVAGYERVESGSEKISRLLREQGGYLPYNDKSEPQAIYDYFGMSKKTFKMALGALYKERKIEFTQTGIKLAE